MSEAKEIAALIAGMEANLDSADELTRGLSHQQFNWRAEPGRWSIAQCLTHVNMVNNLDLAPLEQAIAAGCSRGITGEGPFHYGFLATKFVASQDLPIKRKFKAPKSFVPPPEADPEKTIGEYRVISGEIRRLMLLANGLDLARVKVALSALPAPLRAIVKMPLGARFTLLVNHDRRHLWQAGEVRKQTQFPR